MQSIHCDTKCGILSFQIGALFNSKINVVPCEHMLVENRIKIPGFVNKEDHYIFIGDIELKEESEIKIIGEDQIKTYILYNWPILPAGKFKIFISYNGNNPGDHGYINLNYVPQIE